MQADCFGQVDLPLWQSIASAFEERKICVIKSRGVGGKSKALDSDWAHVAASFRACATTAVAEERDSQAVKMYRRAGRSHEKGKREFDAAVDFEYGHQFNRAAKLFLELDRLEDAVRAAAGSGATEKTKERVYKVARIYYVTNRLLEKARVLFQDDNAFLKCESQDPLFDCPLTSQVRRPQRVWMGRFPQRLLRSNRQVL